MLTMTKMLDGKISVWGRTRGGTRLMTGDVPAGDLTALYEAFYGGPAAVVALLDPYDTEEPCIIQADQGSLWVLIGSNAVPMPPACALEWIDKIAEVLDL